jgi:hypothetical protein
MTEVALTSQETANLQSCTVSPTSCSCTSDKPSDALEVISINVEEGSSVIGKVEKPEPIPFATMKDEPDEVSYLLLCIGQQNITFFLSHKF